MCGLCRGKPDGQGVGDRQKSGQRALPHPKEKHGDHPARQFLLSLWIDGTLEGCIFLIVLRNMEQVMELSTNINELMDDCLIIGKASKRCAGPNIP